MAEGKSTLGLGPVLGVILALMGILLGGGGAWLAWLGGSWYYLIAGIVLVLAGALLVARHPGALWVYAALVLGTLVWALWEVGLDWWQLSPRGAVIFVVGLILLLPWVTRGLTRDGAERRGEERRSATPRGGVFALAASLVIATVVAIASWFTNPHDLSGTLPEVRASLEDEGQGVPPEDWHAYGRTGLGNRYSPLDQITPENVDQLEVAWEYNTGDFRGPGDPEETTYEVTPLKIRDTVYLCTPHTIAIALDAETGEERWRYDAEVQGELALQHLTCRGLAYHTGGDETTPEAGEAETAAEDGETAPAGANECPERLFLPTPDARLIALDLENGERCESFGQDGEINLWENMPHAQDGFYYSTSAPAIAGDLVIVGGAINDNVSTTEPSGVIRAYDVYTGELVWNWDPGNPEETEPIAEGETYTESTPNSWSTMSVDENLGMVYIPMANAAPDQWGGNRTEEIDRFSSSVVALDTETGELQWVFQTVHHDLWDYDVPAQPSLIDLEIDGEQVPALVQPTKQGELFVLDRRTGEPALPVEERPVPQGGVEDDRLAPTQPVSALSFAPDRLNGSDMWGATMFDQMLCRISFRQLRYEGRYTPPTTEGTLQHPGNFGVFNWGSVAVDPRREIVFTTPSYLPFVSNLVPRPDDETPIVSEGSTPALNENFGAPYAVELGAFISPLNLPCNAPPWGYVAGADLRTGDIVWRHKNGTVRDRAPVPLPFKMGVPDLGGPMLTAGGVAFMTGTLDYYVRAYDVTTGEQLWEERLPAGGQATPMTYAAEDGRQYLLVVAGGHGSLGTKAGDSIIAYALPEN